MIPSALKTPYQYYDVAVEYYRSPSDILPAPFTASLLRYWLPAASEVPRGTSDFPPAQGCEPCPFEADGLVDFIIAYFFTYHS